MMVRLVSILTDGVRDILCGFFGLLYDLKANSLSKKETKTISISLANELTIWLPK